jgi:sterol desaturase/sphingolipid hydroxylase (fatty acid hydroxylase superfamily)
MPSIKHFTIVNSILLTFGYVTFFIYEKATTAMPVWFFLVNVLFSEVLRNMHPNDLSKTVSIYYWKKITPIAVLNAATLLISCELFAGNTSSLVNEIVWFIPFSFGFEIIFDFFHYISHRLFHSMPALYAFHSIHHRQHQISVYTTFEHHPIDLIGTNAIPVVLTSLLLYPSRLFICTWMIYKLIEEMSGHAGVFIKSSSFPQFVWLPRVFGIELYSSDHSYHHTHPSKNFAKRFRLWDKVFDTYVATR